LPESPQTFTLTNEVGGLFGLGKTACTTKLTFNRNQYYLGEYAKVAF